MSGPDAKAKEKEHKERVAMALGNIEREIASLDHSRGFSLARMTSGRLREAFSAYRKEQDPEKRLRLGGEVLDLFDRSIFRRLFLQRRRIREDLRLCFSRPARVKTIDHSDRGARDYYSVVVIVKNEARYMREFILFYLATGADRIYVYDNDSTDDLLEVLEPFLKNGRVVYTYWPGKVVQTAAYRHAVRRTKRRTKWLAVIDADEFLFSPKGSMPDQLRRYEQYPGIGVNWVMFGPNGHDRRPEGLVMDNYTTTFADRDFPLNCHIKSIVQPARVLLVSHSHYSYYKKGEFAVDEGENRIGNTNAFAPMAGRAFTPCHRGEVFRINHYNTKSIEDLEAKYLRGFPDGSPSVEVEEALRPFREPLAEDHAISRYADMVRERYHEDM